MVIRKKITANVVDSLPSSQNNLTYSMWTGISRIVVLPISRPSVLTAQESYIKRAFSGVEEI
jgi:hypothetical protein